MPNKFTIEEFIQRSIDVHGPVYDYSKVRYIDIETKVCIICPVHGKFYQSPNNHIHKHGCPTCGLERRSIKRRMTTEEFIKKANKVHGIGTYDYSKTSYIDLKKKVCIICKKHGEIWQRASFHLGGYGCYKCSWDDRKFSVNEFIARANDIHGIGTYDYSLVELRNNMQDKISIICKKHGIFIQRAQQHLEHGCPHCKDSKGERAIKIWLIKNGINFKAQYSYPDLTGCTKKALKFDFYIPIINLLIEFDGEQHFCPMRFKEIEKCVTRFRKVCDNDSLKDQYCSKNKIPLLRIPYKNYDNIPEIMASFFGGPLDNLLKLVSFEEYGFNKENVISDFLAHKISV